MWPNGIAFAVFSPVARKLGPGYVPPLVMKLRAIALACAWTLLALTSEVSFAQMGQFPQSPMPSQPPRADDEKPRDPVPPPEPLSPEAEEARERAQARGVLRAESARPGQIYEIRVIGARKVEPDAVLVQVQSRVGRPPDQRVLQSDVRRIFKMGLFADVVIRAAPGPEGSIVLTYVLTERPSIANVLIEGNRDVSDDDIEEVIDLRAYQVLDVQRVRQTVEKIEKLYVDKGFFLAEVSYELRPSTGVRQKDDDNLAGFFQDLSAPVPRADPSPAAGPDTDSSELVDVVFLVEENAKVKVEQIVFVGNQNVSDDALKNVMRTRENHPLGVFSEWGTYKEELAEIDLLGIEAVYQDQGFINVRVGQPRVELSTDKTRLSLYIPITEGKQFRLGRLDVQGELLIDDAAEFQRIRDEEPERIVFLKQQVMDRIRSQEGEIFVRSTVGQDLMAVADRYRDRGYAYVNVSPETRVDEAAQTLDLVLQISSGPRVLVERIEVKGNLKTQDEVIRREMRVFEGEYYSASALRLSEQRVNALGFFEKVEVTTRQGSTPDRMEIVVDVQEKATGTFQLGAGFSNAESFIFTGQVAQNNFLGRGWTVSGSLQWSGFRQILDFRFVDPYFTYIGQEPLTFAFTAYNTQRYYLDFFRNSTGGDVTLGYPVGRPLRGLTRSWIDDAPRAWMPYVPDFENLQLYLTATGERVEIAEQSFDVRLLGLSSTVPRYTTSLRGSLIFDQRNNRLFPSQGYFVQVQAELASPYFGSALLPSAESGLKSGLSNIDALQDNLGFLKTTGSPTAFTRLSFTGRAYYLFDQILPVSGVVAKGNVEVGALLTDDPTLIFERYYLGGFNTIRGYPLRSIGPAARVGGLDPSDPLQEFRIGGNKQFFLNLELEFPLFEQVGIRGVLFFDAGNAYGADENFFYLGNDPTPFLQNAQCAGQKCFDPRTDLKLLGVPWGLFSAVGFGVRWFSPIGPLRFEWGIPLNARPAGTFGLSRPDQSIQFEFNIGQSF